MPSPPPPSGHFEGGSFFIKGKVRKQINKKDMRKRKVTYGVQGMMTYQALIPAGRVNVKLTFEGGSVTASGRRPATFTTDNFMIQQIIENSEDFRKGKIFRYRVLILDENVEIEMNKPEHHHHHHPHHPEEGKGCPGRDFEVEIPDNEGVDIEEAEKTETEEIEEPEKDEISVETEVGAVSEEIPGLEFSSNDEAKDYLAAHFSVEGLKLHTRKDIIEAGKGLGIEIRFK